MAYNKFFTTLDQHQASLRAKKFTTSMSDHERGKKRWGLPKPHTKRGRRAAADPEWLQRWIEVNGPYLKHETTDEVTRDKILREGLIPHDQPNPADDLGMPIGSQYSYGLTPRSNHVYVQRFNFPFPPNLWLASWNKVFVDLRKLDPDRINADEDSLYANQRIWKLPERERLSDGNYEGRGAWADRVLNNDPAYTAHSLNWQGTAAIQGGVSPEALVHPDVALQDMRENWPRIFESRDVWYGGITPEQFRVGQEPIPNRIKGIAGPADPEHVGSWNFAHKAPEPPHYKPGTATKNCGKCTMFDKGKCWGYGNQIVSKDYVCDSFEPEKKSIFSAVDPNWLAEYMEKNGPYLYHGTDPYNIQNILNTGLYPHDEPSIGTRYTDYLRPRPNHVYLGDHKTAASYARTRQANQLLRIDLRKLDPWNMNPDEDHMVHLLGNNTPELLPNESYGMMAERLGWGNQPYNTRYSLESGSIAHNGYIPPHAIDIAPVDAHMNWGMQRSNPNGLPNMADQWISPDVSGKELSWTKPEVVSAITHPLYHWTDAKNLDGWLDASEISPAGTYLTENGEDPNADWNPDIPFMDHPVRISIDPDKLDPNQFGYDPDTGEGYQNGLEWGNLYYKGIIPRDAILAVTPFKAPASWDDGFGHGNNDSEDESRHHDVQFGNDYGLTVGAKVASPPYAARDPLLCANCGSHMTEPQQHGNEWINTCPNCRATYKIPPNSPALQQWQNEWNQYPQMLKEVNKPSLWNFATRQSDYQGWTNWDTWHTHLMAQNDSDHYHNIRNLMRQGLTPQGLRDYHIQHIIGPYNKRQIADAQEWNLIPQEERLDHSFEDLKGRNPQAADIVDALGFGPNVEDEQPNLIDPELVNWDEIHHNLRNDMEEDAAYGNEPAPQWTPEQLPQWDIPQNWHQSAVKVHSNYYTGEPCHCGFDWTKFVPTHTAFVKTADKFHDFLANPKARPDLQTPEGQSFLNTLANYWNEKVDPLTPWLTREWKKGRIREHPSPDVRSLQWQGPFHGRVDPQIDWWGLNWRQLDHWADFYNSNHPEKRAMGDIMQKTLPEFLNHVGNWDYAMEQAKEQEAASHGETVHRYPDNWTLRKLTQPEELKAEGANMSNCVGGYANSVANGNSLIYSLRDPEGKPHTTMEISPSRFSDSAGNPIAVDWQNHELGKDQPIPHGGEVVQIQGKGNGEPLPEYKDRLKQWFHTFSPEEKPQWNSDQNYESIYTPDDIEDRHLRPYFEEDEYGLARPKPDVSWPSMMDNLVEPYRSIYHSGHYDYEGGERAYQLARNLGQIPQFATAFGNWEEKTAQPDIDRSLEANLDYMPHYDPDDPNFDEAEYDNQYTDAWNQILEDNPYPGALNHIHGLLSPHYDFSTQSYQNVPEQPNSVT